MGERLVTHEDASPIHLPPRSAWKPKYRHLYDSTEPLLTLPADDRGFVIPDEVIHTAKDWFVPGYEWTFDPDDYESRADDHHFHGEAADYKRLAAELGSDVPLRFRGNPLFIGKIPRKIHNAIHKNYQVAEIPEIEPMEEFLERYQIAKQAFIRLHNAAESTLDSHDKKLARRNTLRHNPTIAADEEDSYATWLLNYEFQKNFAQYQLALQAFQLVNSKDILPPGKEIKLERPTPQQILRIGKTVAQKAVDYRKVIAA